ncbi:hypothetical protein GCM10009741_80050 [Kribbella lupini]|uniref:Uncharacterized protein n=1 Tax=Kribbella lupini TaxID=291602 RepID=A0ABN2CQA2_9ACTN
MVRYAGPLGLGDLRRTDVHPAVDLVRVGADHLAAEVLAQSNGQVGLAGRGGTDDGDDEWCGHRSSVTVRSPLGDTA